ncbi:hypothetical protein ACFL2B_00720 [Patescibacteria group bacterium]
MTDYHDIPIKGSVDDLKKKLADLLGKEEYEVNWASPYAGTAEKGSSTKSILFGAMAKHFFFQLQIYSAPDKQMFLRLIKPKVEMLERGALGIHQANKEFQKIVELVYNYLKKEGISK